MDVALQVARVSAFGGVVYGSVKLGILKVEDSDRVGRFTSLFASTKRFEELQKEVKELLESF
uniref:Uncharacterized protein n=1 Tax=Aegilops tauschii TaxID=37682 RepID=M8AT69_AEGTA